MKFGPLSWRPVSLEYKAAGIIISDFDLFSRNGAKDLTFFIRTQGFRITLWRTTIFNDFDRALTLHHSTYKKFHRKLIGGVPLVGGRIISSQIVCATKFTLGRFPIPFEAKSHTGV